MLTERMPQVSVVVPVYNGEGVIEECLEALLNQDLSKEAYEIIVVDNGSADRTIESVTRYPVRLLQEAVRSGYAARNTGLHAARGSILASTDADCRPCPQWLSASVRAIANGADCVGGRIEHQVINPDSPWEFYTTLCFFDQRRYVANGWAATANLIITRELFERMGPFRVAESGSDKAWGLHASAHGAVFCYSEEAMVSHLTRKRFRAIAETLRRYAVANGRLERQQSRCRSFIVHKMYNTFDQGPNLRPLLRLCRAGLRGSLSLRSTIILLLAWPVLESIRLSSCYRGWRQGRLEP